MFKNLRIIFIGISIYFLGYFLNFVGTYGYTQAMPIFQRLNSLRNFCGDIFPLYLKDGLALFSLGDFFLCLAPILTISFLIWGYINEKNNNI